VIRSIKPIVAEYASYILLQHLQAENGHESITGKWSEHSISAEFWDAICIFQVENYGHREICLTTITKRCDKTPRLQEVAALWLFGLGTEGTKCIYQIMEALHETGKLMRNRVHGPPLP
jgi:hypothetical protein